MAPDNVRVARQSRLDHRLLTLLGLLLVGLLVALATQPSWALRPSHEADRLLMATEEAFAEDNYDLATQHLTKVRQLGVALPVEYDYLYGKLLRHQGNFVDARKHLEAYVNRTGRDGVFYKDALALITDIEKQRGKANATTKQTANINANNDEGKSEIRWSNSSREYIDHIKGLYNTQDSTKALTAHVNNLLKFYAYGDKRIIAGSRVGKPTKHQIQVTPKGELISMNQLGADANEPFQEDRFPVYGVNPYISYECNYSSASCWLLHPVTSNRWLQIVENEEAAAELAKAMSELLKSIQQTG